jgi:hypothetical protein
MRPGQRRPRHRPDGRGIQSSRAFAGALAAPACSPHRISISRDCVNLNGTLSRRVVQAASRRASSDANQSSSEPSFTPSNRNVDR